MIDHEALKRIVRDLYVSVIHAKFGEEGTGALRGLLDALTQLYQRLVPEVIRGKFILFQPLTSFAQQLPPNPRVAHDVVDLATSIKGPSAVALQARGFHVWNASAVDPVALSREAIVYTFEGGAEQFIIDGTGHSVPVVDTAQASIFARPTFGSLHDALKGYHQRIRHSSCHIFQKAWADPNRLFFKSHCEKEMRRSLHHYLTDVLRDVSEVREEQNVSDTEPVDIKVTWMFTTGIALIEIKWLGKSLVNGHFTADYNEARANEGAKQLADYIDDNKEGAPAFSTRGYLVVIDGRRWYLNEQSTTVSRKNGMKYESSEITYDPAYHQVRDDFEEPIRYFCEPVCDAT